MKCLLASGIALFVWCPVLCPAAIHLQESREATLAGTPLYRQTSAPVEKRVDDLLRRMTLQEKVRQLDMYS
ncbi:MAG: hypothetical protein ACRD3F_10100 [Acidobacteriaceae bacterium]